MGFSGITRNIAIRLGHNLSPLSKYLLRKPIFIVGFNNSAKSTIAQECLAHQASLSVFPGEGNDVLWFRGFYPWADMNLDIPPIWYDQERFTRAVVESRKDSFREARAQLGCYQIIRAPFNALIVDSGMLAALLPDVMPVFQDAKVIHIVRDGRAASFITSKIIFGEIEKDPKRYKTAGCPVDFNGVAIAQAHYWCWTLNRIQQVKDSFPKKVLQIRYEDFCANPKTVLNKIMGFIDLHKSSIISDKSVKFTNRNVDELSEMTTSLRERIDKIQRKHLLRFGYEV